MTWNPISSRPDTSPVIVVAVNAPEGVPSAVRRAEPTLESVLAALDGVRSDDVVLATRDGAARGTARSARLVLGAERLATLDLTGVPLTAWALVLGALTQHVLPASSARAVADEVLGHIRTRALLSSVASLTTPTPTFRQHAGSLLPQSAFVVDTVRGTVGRFLGSLGLPDGESIATARSARPVVPTTDDLLPRPADVDLGVPAGPRSAGWPASRWFEASVLDTPLTTTTTGIVARIPGWARCDVCRRPVPGACPFCDVTTGTTRPEPSSRLQELVR